MSIMLCLLQGGISIPYLTPVPIPVPVPGDIRVDLQLEPDGDRGIGALGVDDESLRSLSTEVRLAGDGERRLIAAVHDDVVACELGFGSGDV
ncbi:hypothetical protein GGR55DRAFT_678170 [Xylaria sp. FL0064]|nr:hypothetical protein GGR55DRAFT_678170 [Xylaria sp. FL0064]